MKNKKNKLLLISLILFLALGCNNCDFSASKNANNEESRPPKSLTAKMLNNFPIPADAKVVDDRESVEKFLDQKRIIKLEAAEAVYDISHFFRQELKKNGWTGDKGNESRNEDPRSIISNLEFSNETEEADISIVSNTDDGSEIEIIISKKLETIVPFPACARKANRIINNDELTIRANCQEDLSVLAKFYSEEFPKKGWTLANQPEDSVSDEAAKKTVKIAFTKENLKAVVSLIERGIDRTSVKILISKVN